MPSFPHTFKWPFVLDAFLDQSTLALFFSFFFQFLRVTAHFSEPTALPRHKRSFSNRSLDINSMRVFFVGSSKRDYLTIPGRFDLFLAYPIPGRFDLLMHFLFQVALAYLLHAIPFPGRFGLLLTLFKSLFNSLFSPFLTRGHFTFYLVFSS
jgi:hypothetical protein